MLKVTLKELVESYDSLMRVAKMEFMVETRWKMVKVLLAVEAEKKAYDTLHMAMLKEHGEQVGPTQWNIKKEQWPTFGPKFDALGEQVAELSFDKFPLVKMEAHVKQPADLVALAWLIDLSSIGEEKKETE